MKTGSAVQNFRQKFVLYSSLLTGAPIANRRQRGTYKDTFLTDLLKKEKEIVQRFPPKSIASYQLIQIPRMENDPDNGKIGFLFTDGFYHMNNVWRTVDEVIRKWEDCD